MLDIRPLALPEVLEIVPQRFTDERGFFSETWNAASWAKAGIALDFVQDNHSLSTERGVLRGLHFQTPPFAQDKLIRVTRGAVFDVAIDLRPDSPRYRRWVGTILSADRGNQLLVPKGFAHGFVTLEPDTEMLYKVTAPYSRDHDRTFRFDDPDIGVSWPIAAAEIQISAKDAAAPRLRDLQTGF